jgi:hypothetical protein
MSVARAPRFGGIVSPILGCAVLAFLAPAHGFLSGDGLRAQTTYQAGQNVAPAFEGWVEKEDGTFSLLFGYMNRNWQEEPEAPVGPDNFVSPGPQDQGQPTHFRPRRNRFVFEVPVPADFGDQEMVWTLTTNGVTEHAYGSLHIDYKIDDIVIASETGALGIGISDAETRANQPPTIWVEGESVRRVRVGEPLTLVVMMEDDGLADAIERSKARAEAKAKRIAEREGPPRLSERQLRPPIRITVNKVVAHHIAWFVYRGAGGVTFDPPQVKTWEDTRAGANSPWAPLWVPPPVPEDGRWVVDVTFDEPGTYTLRARGDDGALFHDQDVTVIVGPVTTS